MKTNNKLSAYILRGSTTALLFSYVIVALCWAINLPEQPPTILAPQYGAGPTPTPTCAPPPPNMVSWWPGDGNADDIVDGNNGTFVGASYATGEVGQAFSFNGSNYVQVPDAANLDFANSSPISIDMWVYRIGNGSVMHFIGKRFECGTVNYQMYLNTGSGEGLVFGGSSGGVATGQDLPLNTWTHLAGTFDGSTFRFYINGTLAGTAAGVAIGPTNNQPLRIGTSGLCENFVGLIDEVELFNRALSQAEIQAIYNAGSAGKCRTQGTPTPTPTASPTPSATGTPTCVPPPPNMVSWWPGDGNADDIIDGNSGTLQGGATFAQGEVQQAFSFNGVDAYIDIPHNDNLDPTGPFSVDAWVKADPSQVYPQSLIVDKSHGITDSTGWVMQTQTDGTGCFGYGLGGGGNTNFIEVCTQASILDNQWHHLAGVWTGTAAQIYKDAVLQNVVNSTQLPVNNNRDVHIGVSWGGGTPIRFFHGLVDEVEYFNRALSQAEIQAIYNAGSAGKCKCVTPPPNMVSWWPGDGNANDIQDGHDGTLQGGVTFAPGEVDQAFNFLGVNGYVDLGTWFDFQSFTVDMWINPAPGSEQQEYADIIDNNHTNFRSWVCQYMNTDDVYRFGTSGASGAIDIALTPNTWQHLALTRDGVTYEARAYVNGALVGSASGSRDIVYDGTQFLRLGHWGGGGRYFKGLEDEIEVFNRALSQAEVQAIYNAGSAGKCKPQGSPSPTPTATVTPTATATATATSTATATPTATPCTGRCSPTPRPRPTPAPRP